MHNIIDFIKDLNSIFIRFSFHYSLENSAHFTFRKYLLRNVILNHPRTGCFIHTDKTNWLQYLFALWRILPSWLTFWFLHQPHLFSFPFLSTQYLYIKSNHNVLIIIYVMVMPFCLSGIFTFNGKKSKWLFIYHVSWQKKKRPGHWKMNRLFSWENVSYMFLLLLAY